ncbi:MAG: hypothetical protein FWD88_07325, partial [Treponema sp.]|nr:hypothetical protein [Treponema sp.]
GFVPGANYSIVVVARRHGFADAVSAVRLVEMSRPESLADLEIRPGAAPGEIVYTFSATVPPATYVMHYIQGDAQNADEVKNGGNSRVLVAGSNVAIGGLTPGASYSIVVVAESHGEVTTSGIMRVRASAALVPGLDGLEIGRGGHNPYNKHRVPPVGRNHIELAYSFGSPVPAAEYHTLYFIQEAGADAERIIRYGNYRRLVLENGDLSGFTADLGLSVDHAYSVVVVARGIVVGEDLRSDVAQIAPVPNNILIVHNIPEHSEVMVSAILTNNRSANVSADLLLGYFDVTAVGYRVPGTGMFVFYDLCADGEYDPGTPWTDTTGTRLVTLSDSEEDGVGNQFIVHGGGPIRLPARIEMANRLELTWSRFMIDFR